MPFNQDCDRGSREGTGEGMRKGVASICRHCNIDFIARPSTKNKGWYCSRKCGALHRSVGSKNEADRNRPYPKCDRCQILLNRRDAKYCKECRVMVNREQAAVSYYKRYPINPKPCRMCGVMFTPVVGVSARRTVGFCSTKCRKINNKKYHKNGKSARKAKLKMVESCRYSRDAIFERDGWQCHLCGKPVDRRAVVPDPMAPTIDHVIPLALSGPDTPRNVRCAHFLCNSNKGDSLI